MSCTPSQYCLSIHLTHSFPGTVHWVWGGVWKYFGMKLAGNLSTKFLGWVGVILYLRGAPMLYTKPHIPSLNLMNSPQCSMVMHARGTSVSHTFLMFTYWTLPWGSSYIFWLFSQFALLNFSYERHLLFLCLSGSINFVPLHKPFVIRKETFPKRKWLIVKSWAY